MKRYIILTWAILTLVLITAAYLQGRQIQKLENKLLLEKVNKDQKQIIVEIVPRYINKIAPLPVDKAVLGDKLYGGE